AVFLLNRTGLVLRSRRMACLALRIIGGWHRVHCLMRIMARHTTNPPISRIVAFAIRQPIGLKPDVIPIVWSVRRDIGPCPVTLPAEVRYLLRAQPRELRDTRTTRISRLGRTRMVDRGVM